MGQVNDDEKKEDDICRSSEVVSTVVFALEAQEAQA